MSANNVGRPVSVLWSLVGLVGVCLVWLTIRVYFPQHGLDPSWVSATQSAVETGRWFPDFVFTYGPAKHFIIFNPEFGYGPVALYMLCYALIFASILTGGNPALRYFALSFCIVMLLSGLYGYLNILAFLYILGVISHSRIAIVLCFFAPIFVFGKYNVGIMVILSCVLALGWEAVFSGRWRENLLKIGIALAASLAAFYLWFGPVDMLAFARDHIDIVSGYSEAMTVHDNNIAPAIVTLMVAIGIVAATARQFGGGLAAVTMTLLFFAYREGYTRADGHIEAFWSVLLFVALAWAMLMAHGGIFSRAGVRANLGRICTVALPAGALGVSILLGYVRPGPMMLSLSSPGRVLTQFDQSLALQADFGTHLGVAGRWEGETVDGFPIELGEAIYSAGTYRGRPVIQEYSAYTQHLKQRNLDFLASDRAPSVLLVRSLTEDIDNRLPGLSAGLMIPEILSRYSFACEATM
ncbi:MAG: hypothetical protein AAF334_03610, partial [Pseudomonadota bacterium]